jgi:toxin FitB
MIILDTNIISALMRASAEDECVVNWLDQQPNQSIWVTSITVLESRLGLGLLPSGKKRSRLEDAFNQLIADDLENRVLPFDMAAAIAAADLAVVRQRAGKPVDIRDTQIAGIAMSRRATIATRNIKHFDDIPTPVINPFTA